MASCELSSVSREFASVFNRSVLIFHVLSCRRCVIPSFIPGVNGDISLPHSSQNSLHFGRGQLNFTLGASAVVNGWIRLYHMLGRSTVKFHRAGWPSLWHPWILATYAIATESPFWIFPKHNLSGTCAPSGPHPYPTCLSSMHLHSPSQPCLSGTNQICHKTATFVGVLGLPYGKLIFDPLPPLCPNNLHILIGVNLWSRNRVCQTWTTTL